MSPAGESERSRIGILRAVAVLILAAALLFPGPAGAAVVIEGAPPWLRERMERSAASVWSEIRQDGSLSAGDSLRLLSLVAERVFAGFAVEDSFFRGEDAVLRIKPLAGTAPWRVEIFPPQLASPVDGWFRESASGIGERIRDHLGNLPLDALSWADSPLKELIDTLCSPGLPGWSASLLVRLEQEGPVLRVSFVPKPPFVLAVVPRVSSGTLPVMLRSDLNENILRTLSPVVGLPIEWVSAHRDKVEKMAAESLRQTNIVGNTRSTVEVSFRAAQIAAANALVESPKYSVRAWVAAYAGSDTKYPEIGLHMGRKFLPVSGWDMEFYGEWILSANDFSLESRWGIRWSPWKNILAGVERAFPGNVTWYRLWIEGGVRAPYLWWRLSEDGDHHVGLGYRLNQRISLEIHYDGRDEDKISIRALSDL